MVSGTVLQCGAPLLIHTLNYWTDRVVRDASFLTGCVFECDIAHVDLRQYHVCYTRSGVTRRNLLMVLSWAVCASASYTQCFGRTSVHVCASSLQDLAALQDFYSALSIVYLCAKILVTPYSIVLWDWRFKEQG